MSNLGAIGDLVDGMFSMPFTVPNAYSLNRTKNPMRVILTEEQEFTASFQEDFCVLAGTVQNASGQALQRVVQVVQRDHSQLVGAMTSLPDGRFFFKVPTHMTLDVHIHALTGDGCDRYLQRRTPSCGYDYAALALQAARRTSAAAKRALDIPIEDIDEMQEELDDLIEELEQAAANAYKTGNDKESEEARKALEQAKKAKDAVSTLDSAGDGNIKGGGNGDWPGVNFNRIDNTDTYAPSFPPDPPDVDVFRKTRCVDVTLSTDNHYLTTVFYVYDYQIITNSVGGSSTVEIGYTQYLEIYNRVDNLFYKLTGLGELSEPHRFVRVLFSNNQRYLLHVTSDDTRFNSSNILLSQLSRVNYQFSLYKRDGNTFTKVWTFTCDHTAFGIQPTDDRIIYGWAFAPNSKYFYIQYYWNNFVSTTHRGILCYMISDASDVIKITDNHSFGLDSSYLQNYPGILFEFNRDGSLCLSSQHFWNSSTTIRKLNDRYETTASTNYILNNDTMGSQRGFFLGQYLCFQRMISFGFGGGSFIKCFRCDSTDLSLTEVPAASALLTSLQHYQFLATSDGRYFLRGLYLGLTIDTTFSSYTNNQDVFSTPVEFDVGADITAIAFSKNGRYVVVATETNFMVYSFSQVL